MAAVAYSTYFPQVIPFVPGCPIPTILDAFQRTAYAFFLKSYSYRLWLPTFDLTVATTTYTLGGLPTGTEVAQIMELKCNGIDVKPLSHEQFFAYDPEWPSLTGTNAQYYTSLNDVSTFNIIPSPTATDTGAFFAQVALTPTLVATGVEQSHLEQWKDGLIDGVLSRLMEMPGKTWTNVKEAVTRHERYHGQAIAARIQANKGNIRRDLHVQMRRWV